MPSKTYVATNGKGQIHYYGADSWGYDDFIHRHSFEEITRFSHGHHGRTGTDKVRDIIDFVDIDNVKNTIVGRMEDFDPSRDEIRIEGRTLDFNNLPSNVRIVEYNGDHNDAGSYAQQWMLIDTGPGYIFYALEGARIDMDLNGGANLGAQEAHFISAPPDFSTLKDVKFIDQYNYVPDGFSPQGGLRINDEDVLAIDVITPVLGGAEGDLIAAGLNDDVVFAGHGNDLIWGGSGHDTVSAGLDNDTVLGGTGDDVLNGGSGNDLLDGEVGDDLVAGDDGDDIVNGLSGNDTLRGGEDQDTLIAGDGHDSLDGNNGDDSLSGGHGNDLLLGGNGIDRIDGDRDSDTIRGGDGKDHMWGGDGSDHFVFTRVSDTALGHGGRDVIRDFNVHEDRIDLEAIDANLSIDGNQAFRFAGTTAQENSVWLVAEDADLLLRGDVDGDGEHDFVVDIKNVSEMTANDFFL